jgi:hypothetical protein
MKKFLVSALLLFASAAGWGQLVGGPIFGCTGSPSTGTGWTSATSVNATQVLSNNPLGSAILVTLDQGTTITGGAISFLANPGDGNFVTVPAYSVVDPTTAPFATISLPYTLVASTNKQFLVLVSGYVSVELKLTTAITGTATVTPYTVNYCGPTPGVIYQASNANLNASVTFPSAQLVQQNPITGSASATSVCLLTANTTAASCKASAGNVYGFSIYNPNASLCVMQVFNTSSITLGTTQELLDIPVLPTGGNNYAYIFPVNFSADIYVASTTAAHGATTCTTGMLVNLFYE